MAVTEAVTGGHIGIYFGNEHIPVDQLHRTRISLERKEKPMALPAPDKLIKAMEPHVYQERGSGGGYYRFERDEDHWVPAHVADLLLFSHPDRFAGHRVV